MSEPLTRSTTDKMIVGVCGGVARTLGWDRTLVRILWVVTTVLIGLPGLAYLVMWLVVPDDQGNKVVG